MSRVALTIYYSSEAGEVSKIVEGSCLKREDSLLRADVLKDCLIELGEKYNDAMGQFQQDVREMTDARHARPASPPARDAA